MSFFVTLIVFALSSPEPGGVDLACRDSRAPDVEGPGCVEARGVIQPCAGVLLPKEDVISYEMDRASLLECRKLSEVSHQECRSLMASDARGAAEREGILAQQLVDANKRADAHLAEIEKLRSSAGGGGSLAGTVAAVALIAAGAAALIPCISDGSDGLCFVSGLSLGVGGAVIVF